MLVARRYFAWVAGTLATLGIAAAILGVLVDPYYVYGTPTLAGWNSIKPRVYQHAVIAKRYQIGRIRPTTLLLGNSRIEIGLDPESSSWPAEMQPVFNAAVSGAGLATAVEMLCAGVATHTVKTVILGLDIVDFLTTVPAPATARDSKLQPANGCATESDHGVLQVWRDRLATTLTIDAIWDDFATLAGQDPAGAVTMTPLGYNPLQEYRVFVARDGYRTLFTQKKAMYERQFAHYRAPDFSKPVDIPELRDLHRLIDIAGAHNIKLILLIHPYHADFLEMLHRLDLWLGFKDWKRALVKLIGDETAGPAISLFDFSGYNEYSTESVPPIGSPREMKWYWEPGHYKAALGDQMLRSIFHGESEFGHRLTALNVNQVLIDIDTAREEFISGRTPAGPESRDVLDEHPP